jgi:hypothetical protein
VRGLKAPAAQELAAVPGDDLRAFHDLLLAFHRTWTGHDGEIFASANHHFADRNFGRGGTEFLAHKLVGRRDAHGLFDLRHGFERLEAGGDVADAYGADDYALLSLNGVDLQAEFLDAGADLFHFLLGCVAAHGNNHGGHLSSSLLCL